MKWNHTFSRACDFLLHVFLWCTNVLECISRLFFYCSITLKFIYPFSTDEDLSDVLCIFNQFFENFTRSVLTIFLLLVILFSDPPHLLHPPTLCASLCCTHQVYAVHTCGCVVLHSQTRPTSCTHRLCVLPFAVPIKSSSCCSYLWLCGVSQKHGQPFSGHTFKENWPFLSN